MKTRKKVLFSSYNPLLERLFSQGINTSWERYEAGLPQNRIASAGFFCNSDCTDGPCHIDPFGNKTSQAVCGRTACEITSAWLCQAVAKGLARRLLETRDESGELPAMPKELVRLMAFPVQYRMEAQRVALLLKEAATAVMNAEADAAHTEPLPSPGNLRCGLGARNPLRPAVLLDGLDTDTARQIASSLESSGLDCLVSGNERVGFSAGLRVMCPSSLVGIVSVAGAVDAVITGDSTRARFMPDAEAGAQVFSPEECLCNVVSSARRHFSDYPPVVATGSTAKWERLEPENGYFIIGGGLSVKTTCGSDTVELVQMAVDDGFGVLAFGDSAAVLGEAGLIGSKGGTCVIPADNPSGLGWAFAMIRDRCLDKPVLAAFPEASSVKDLASALMMSVLGVPTYFGSVLPIWGPELPAKLGLSSAGGIPLITYPSRVAVGAAWKQMREALSS